MPSSTDTSWPSSARARIGRTSRETQSSETSRLPAAPVFMGFLDETALVEQDADAPTEALVQELRGRELREIARSEEHTSELQSPCNLVCRLLLEKKKNNNTRNQ